MEKLYLYELSRYVSRPYDISKAINEGVKASCSKITKLIPAPVLITVDDSNYTYEITIAIFYNNRWLESKMYVDSIVVYADTDKSDGGYWIPDTVLRRLRDFISIQAEDFMYRLYHKIYEFSPVDTYTFINMEMLKSKIGEK